MRGIIAILCLALLFGCLGPAAPGETYTEEGVKEVSVPTTGEEVEPTVEEVQPEAEETVEEEEVTGLEALSQEEVVYRTRDSWDIHGTLYHAKNDYPPTMIILLHELGGTRANYDDVIVPLHEAFPDADVFALDLRGHGESTNKRTWQQMGSSEFRVMRNDVLDSFEEFKFIRPGVSKYYVIGASIGSSVALEAAVVDGNIKKVVMLSPGMNYKDIDISDDGAEYQKSILIAAARDDVYSYESADELYDMSTSASKVLKVYSGSAHGTDLFGATENLETSLIDEIIEFLRN